MEHLSYLREIRQTSTNSKFVDLFPRGPYGPASLSFCSASILGGRFLKNESFKVNIHSFKLDEHNFGCSRGKYAKN